MMNSDYVSKRITIRICLKKSLTFMTQRDDGFHELNQEKSFYSFFIATLKIIIKKTVLNDIKYLS